MRKPFSNIQWKMFYSFNNKHFQMQSHFNIIERWSYSEIIVWITLFICVIFIARYFVIMQIFPLKNRVVPNFAIVAGIFAGISQCAYNILYIIKAEESFGILLSHSVTVLRTKSSAVDKDYKVCFSYGWRTMTNLLFGDDVPHTYFPLNV